MLLTEENSTTIQPRTNDTMKKMKTSDNFVGWHFMKLLNDLPPTPTKEDLLLNLIVGTALEVGFLPEATNAKVQSSWMSPSSLEIESFVDNTKWKGGLAQIVFQLAVDQQFTARMICHDSGDVMIVSFFDEKVQEIVIKPTSTSLLIGRFIVSKSLNSGKILSSIRNFEALKQKLKSNILPPVRDHFYVKSETNWAYPGMMRMPLEMLQQITQYLNPQEIQSLRATSRRFRDSL